MKTVENLKLKWHKLKTVASESELFSWAGVTLSTFFHGITSAIGQSWMMGCVSESNKQLLCFLQVVLFVLSCWIFLLCLCFLQVSSFVNFASPLNKLDRSTINFSFAGCCLRAMLVADEALQSGLLRVTQFSLRHSLESIWNLASSKNKLQSPIKAPFLSHHTSWPACGVGIVFGSFSFALCWFQYQLQRSDLFFLLQLTAERRPLRQWRHWAMQLPAKRC